MKSLLKKLHIMPSQSDDDNMAASSHGCPSSSKGGRSSSRSPSHHRTSQPQPLHSEQKPLSSLSGWLNSLTSRHTTTCTSPPTATSASSSSSSPICLSPLNAARERKEQGGGSGTQSSVASEVMHDAVRIESEPSQPRDPDMEEEYQIKLALELSAREDPEAVQIEAVKQISLGSCPPQNTPAEVIAYRYWNYNALSFDDKILDGFYDLYGILAESASVMMPSLVDLQGMPVSDGICWEAVLVNRADDADLLKLEQKALMMALESRPESLGFACTSLVQKLAVMVADNMGGAVGDPDSMLKEWKNLSNRLRASIGNMVLPLGHLTIGLARHRALMFKVLADSVGVPCRLVKGKQYTGSDDGAVNIVKVNDGREYIVDLMADPGTLIPSDAVLPHQEFDATFFAISPSVRDDNFHMASSNSDASSSISRFFENETVDKRSLSSNLVTSETIRNSSGDSQEQENQILSSLCEESLTKGFTTEKSKISDDFKGPSCDQTEPAHEVSFGLNHPYALARSPSWTEGISSPAMRRMKVNDVSQYMIDAAKENPQLAQKLHDVLLESGVVAPRNLFSEISAEKQEAPMVEDVNLYEDKYDLKMWKNGNRYKSQAESTFGLFLPHLSNPSPQPKVIPTRSTMDLLRPVEALGINRPLDFREVAEVPCSSQCEVPAEQLQSSPINIIKKMPVAAAAATAAVVASSMVVAAAKSNTDTNLEVPIVATAAAVVATTAAVNRQYEQLVSCAPLPTISSCFKNIDHCKKISEEDDASNGQRGSSHGHDGGSQGEHGASDIYQEAERNSDKSTGNESAKSDVTLDDVAEFEISWEEIIMGERIGLGSYGEVYRGDWHGTEVAVKKFLHQDLSGDALEEFRSEVRIMKRLRHPNVVLFMGAVTRVPNLSIVTEFLPRGSLFRLIHRPTNQLDERRRLRMALDVARGMNYLHNCTPVIVHRDLKSPNLLVDRNWVVKVCDFGLSRLKHSTFLSSRSTAGTAEWMAPEVLRNEPSNEKCDVYSFGVILWELCTLQQPWGGMNPMQVVGAVGFQHRRLDIPDDMDPVIADVIMKCWQTDPKLRPSFSEIMAVLKPLQKPTTGTQVSRQRVPPSMVSEMGISQGTEDSTV